jgi:hypothetical protein
MPVLTRNDIRILSQLCQTGLTYADIPEKYKHLIHEPVAKKHHNKQLQFHPVTKHFFYEGRHKFNVNGNVKNLSCMIIL